ncbi:MAG: hypothetical protein EP305_06660 [Bacteroidetes bacterium]|nr:MAG: hypothetical protein EP305_06660 [Bacteroidota bacterium]
MGSSSVFYAIGDLLTWTFGIFEMIGNTFNYSLIVLGFIGLFYWLNLQKKFNDKAKNEGTLK